MKKDHTFDVVDLMLDFGYPTHIGFNMNINNFDEVYLSAPKKFNHVWKYLNIITKYCDYELELDGWHIKERHNNRDKLKAVLDALENDQELEVTEDMFACVQRDGRHLCVHLAVNIPEYDEDIELEIIIPSQWGDIYAQMRANSLI